MIELSLEQIKKITQGASRIEENGRKISFFRFTKVQQELYKKVCADFYMKSFATAGVRLEFETDSENLFLSVEVCKGSSRTFFTHSIFVNDSLIGELSGNIENNENVPFQKTFDLGKGMKKVKILLPWSVSSNLVSLKLDDGAKIIPVGKKRKILMLGDSITQGYDAMRPENAYAVQLADKLNAEALNKGIAGERFFPTFALEKDDFAPDFITVAYGTNDWKYSTKEHFEYTCKGFYNNLRKTYPDTRIFALTPLWRVDIDATYESGVELKYISDYIKQVAETVSDMTVIDCMDFIPHKRQLYQTDGVHPLDSGFKFYGEKLYSTLNSLLNF